MRATDREIQALKEKILAEVDLTRDPDDRQIW